MKWRSAQAKLVRSYFKTKYKQKTWRYSLSGRVLPRKCKALFSIPSAERDKEKERERERERERDYWDYSSLGMSFDNVFIFPLYFQGLHLNLNLYNLAIGISTYFTRNLIIKEIS
jgi:hypothetical protein